MVHSPSTRSPNVFKIYTVKRDDLYLNKPSATPGIIKMIRTFLTLLLATTLTLSFAQVLEKFAYSECQPQNRNDSARIDSFNQPGDLTEINLTTYVNCRGDFEGNVAFTNDTLNLICRPKAKMVRDKTTNEIEEEVEVDLCDCMFKLTYIIRNQHQIDKDKLKINGETLKQINANRIKEDTIEVAPIIDSTWSSDDVFTIVEKTAEFKVGRKDFEKYIDNHLSYPTNIRKKPKGDKVFVEFIVNKDGSIDDSSIRVVRGLTKVFDNEAYRLIKECPDWMPATIRGQPVKQKLVLAISFGALQHGKE